MQDLGIRVLFEGSNFLRLCQGIWVSLKIALISMILSVGLGILMGIIMTSKNKVIRAICRVYLEIVRIMPQLVLLFLVYFGAAKHIGANFSGGIASLAMTKTQVFIHIIIPQTIRRLIPSAVNLLTRMIKTTSLVVLIGVVEVVKVGKQIIDANRYTTPDAALWVYGTIFIMYFIICFPFSKLSEVLERRLRD